MLNSLFSVQKILATSIKGIKVTSNGLIRSVSIEGSRYCQSCTSLLSVTK